MKLTKQGVRDLDHLPGKSAGRRIETPHTIQERQRRCHHPQDAIQVEYDYSVRIEICRRCGKIWQEYDR